MAATSYSLILLGRFPGRDRVVSQTLARVFQRDDNWGLQVVAAAPIVILDALSLPQAEAIHIALDEVESVGSRFEIQEGLDTTLPKVSWPAPPRIKGRLASEFGQDQDAVTLYVPCPYTGQKIAITLKVSISASEGIGVSATAAPAGASPSGSGNAIATARPAPIAVPVPAATPGKPVARTPVPVPAPTPRATPAAGVALPRPASRPTPTPAPAAPASAPGTVNITGLDDLDELTPMEQIPSPGTNTPPASARPIEIPAPNRPPVRKVAMPSPIARPGSGAPLPDVPVIPGPSNSAEPVNVFSDAPMPQDLMASPMDLSAFEANVHASGIRPVNTNGMLQDEIEIAEAEPVPAGEDEDFAVYISKSINPKVHQAVAEVKGISPKEAARLCQNPNVLLAKNISESIAEEIKAKFSGFNVNARVTRG